MKIITEEMRYRKRLCEYTIKNARYNNIAKLLKNIYVQLNYKNIFNFIKGMTYD